jgi:hypothetical protein
MRKFGRGNKKRDGFSADPENWRIFHWISFSYPPFESQIRMVNKMGQNECERVLNPSLVLDVYTYMYSHQKNVRECCWERREFVQRHE